MQAPTRKKFSRPRKKRGIIKAKTEKRVTRSMVGRGTFVFLRILTLARARLNALRSWSIENKVVDISRTRRELRWSRRRLLRARQRQARMGEYWVVGLRFFQHRVSRASHRLGHGVLVSAQILVLVAMIFANSIGVLAGSITYNFGTAGDYTYNTTTTEVTSNQGRLKSQQYLTDGNTSGLWRFDEAEGGGVETSADDASANNNDLTFGTTAPCNADGGAFGAGKINNAVTLDGVPNCVTAADSDSLSINGVNPSMTIEALVKFPNAFDATADIRQAIVDKGNYRLYFAESDGKLKFEMNDGGTSTWSKVGGSNPSNINVTEGLNGSWRQNLPGTVYSLQEYNSKLYVGTSGTVANVGSAEVWRYESGTTWTKIGGDNSTSGTWDTTTFESVLSMTVHGGLLYAGLGTGAGDGELWQYNSSTNSWQRTRAFSGAEEVVSLASDGTYLYAGLGSGASDADVWRCQTSCTTAGNWTQIGGDSASNWNTGYERVRSMIVMGGTVYVGLGDTAGEAEVWRYSGSGVVWTKVGGDGVGSSWAAAGNYEYVFSLATNGTVLYAGLGASAGDAEVYACTSCNGTPSWTKIGGDTANNWNANYDVVRGLTVIGSTVYASLGDTAGEAEVWRYSGSGDTWTKVGGDGTNSSWDANFTSPAGVTNTKEQAYLGTFGSALVVGTGTSMQDQEVWQCTSCDSSPSWSWIGGRDFNSWGAAQMAQVGTMTIHDGKLIVGFGTTNKHAVLWQYDGTIWTQIGGGNINGSNWEQYEFIRSTATFNGDLYAGFGDTASDADVWRLWDHDTNGGTPDQWTQMAGNEVSGAYSSWTTNYEYVATLVSDGTYLYAGLGASNGDGEVWRWDGSTWGGSAIGGTASGNFGTSIDYVWTLAVYGGTLYAGMGGSVGESEVWRYTGSGTTWNKLGGDGVGSPASWDGVAVHEAVRSMTFIGTTLYVGLGDTADEATVSDAEVWACSNCTNPAVFSGGINPQWTQIGGDDLNGGWNGTDYEQVSSLISYNGELYAGLGIEAGDSEIWKYDGSAWSLIGGDSAGTPPSWSTSYESINGLTVYNGRLYAGLGNTNGTTAASDGEVWEYGGNTARITASAQTSWNADTWYHIAAVYNGSDAKLYINGVQNGTTNAYSVTLTNNDQTLSVGSLKGPFTSDGPYGAFSGVIDELRISNTARDPASFVRTQYASSAQTLDVATAQSRAGVLAWSGFDATETANGGTVTYQLSDDNGATWKYWDGDSWESSGGSLNNANSQATVNSNIATFPVTSSGIKWRAIFLGNGDQQVTVNSVQITWTDDLVDPTNPNNVAALNQSGGSTPLTTDTWYNYPNPYFTWTGASDAGSGVKDYYVYFGTSASGDPEVTSGSINAGGAVQLQTGNTLNMTAGLSNGATYYLRVKTRDHALNIADTAVTLFTYKFDNGVPNSPAAVSVNPASYTSNNSYTFFWPMSGGSAPSDPDPDGAGSLSMSGLAGYEFKTNAPSGPYSTYSALQVDTSGNLLLPSGLFTDVPAWQEGQNTFSLRYKDAAGNYSTPVTVNYFYAGSAPSAPQNLQVSPTTTAESPAVTNNFSFTWDQPEFFNGSIKQYHYAVNKLPLTSSNTSITTSRTLAAAPWATQQGKNTLYVVAEDEAGNINYNIYASVDFYTQTPAPAPPTAVQIFDISNRDAAEYAISMKWIEPSKGSGFNGYEVYRSTDNLTYTTAGTSQSPVFIDANLESKIYYYKVKSKDNAGQFSADSSVVNLTPTGRFTSPPVLEEGPTATTKSFSAEVAWRTDRVASSFIEYGTDKNAIGKEKGGETIGTLDLVEDRTVKLAGLEPETTYYYQAVWVDQDGNQGRSELLSFITGLRPKISDVKISNVTLTAATVSWTTTTVATSEIRYGKTKALGSVIDDSDNTGKKHTVRLDDLDDTSLYYFVIAGSDTDGNSIASDEYTFTTLTRPIVSNFAVEPVRDAPTTTLRMTWLTNVPTTSVVVYGPTGGVSQSKSNADYVTAHEIQVTDLGENTPYTLLARSVDEYGNTATSDSLNLTTPDDSRPPRITNLNIEVRSTGVGETQKAQLIVTWETDEPATSQIEFGPGISSDNYPSKTAEDNALTNSHTVIVPELEPAKIYHLRAVSRDRAGNAGTSSDTTAITGKIQRSVVDIIVNSLQRSLGFLGNLPFLRQ